MFQSLMIQYKSLMIQSSMIQYNIIQDHTEEIFLYYITLAINPTQPIDFQLTRAGTTASKFNLFYKPFDKCDGGAQCESTCFAKLSIFHMFYKQFWEVRVHLKLDRPRTKMWLSPKEFHMFWRNISNYHCESDGSVALLSPWKFAMFWKTYQIPDTRVTFLIQSTSQSVVQ